MNKYLPKLPSGSIDRRVELPRTLGGLGLTPPSISPAWPLHDLLAGLTTEHLMALTWIAKAKTGKDIEPPRNLYEELARYASNRYARGTRVGDALDDIIDVILEFLPTLDYNQAREQAIERFKLRPSIGYRQTHQHIKKMGLVGRGDIKQMISRANLLTTLLREIPDRGFKPAEWVTRAEVFNVNLRIVLCRENREENEIDSGAIYDWIMSFNRADKIDQVVQPPELFLDQAVEFPNIPLGEEEPQMEPLLLELRGSGPRMDIPFEAWGPVLRWEVG